MREKKDRKSEIREHSPCLFFICHLCQCCCFARARFPPHRHRTAVCEEGESKKESHHHNIIVMIEEYLTDGRDGKGNTIEREREEGRKVGKKEKASRLELFFSGVRFSSIFIVVALLRFCITFLSFVADSHNNIVSLERKAKKVLNN